MQSRAEPGELEVPTTQLLSEMNMLVFVRRVTDAVEHCVLRKRSGVGPMRSVVAAVRTALEVLGTRR